MDTTRENILKTLSYFDIFHYPLTKAEILSFHPTAATAGLIDNALQSLQEDGAVYPLGEFYSLQNNQQLAERRRIGNAKAMIEMKKAVRASRILARFPFVEGLAISGSLSKNFADENTDIDFFIITRANRLWIARTCMHLFYKLARITGSQRLFCMNYYVDEAGLEIPEKNIFTAMEIITLVPMEGSLTVLNFMYHNNWTKNYFPSHRLSHPGKEEIKKGLFRKFVEYCLDNKTGDRLNNWLQHKTHQRWQKKQGREQLNSKGIAMGMLAGDHYSKPDPRHFQHKVLAQYEYRLNKFIKSAGELHGVAV